MDERELKELQDPSTWADEEGDVRPAVKAPRAIVSVAFSRDDFGRVSESARREGMKTSEFIRNAAIDRANRIGPRAIVVSVSGGVHTEYPMTPLRGARADVRVDSPAEIFATA